MCCGLIWAEMREQQEVKTIGQQENEEGRVENRLFQISVREVISMLAGRRSNEESSILRLQSSFPIASCGVVAWRWLDELSTLPIQNVDRLVGVGSWVMTTCSLVSNHTHLCMYTNTCRHKRRFGVCFVCNYFEVC